MSSPDDFVIVTNPIIKASPKGIQFDCGPQRTVFLGRELNGEAIWQFNGADVEVRRRWADAYQLTVRPDTEQPF
jgi:hypothetical protein